MVHGLFLMLQRMVRAAGGRGLRRRRRPLPLRALARPHAGHACLHRPPEALRPAVGTADASDHGVSFADYRGRRYERGSWSGPREAIRRARWQCSHHDDRRASGRQDRGLAHGHRAGAEHRHAHLTIRWRCAAGGLRSRPPVSAESAGHPEPQVCERAA